MKKSLIAAFLMLGVVAVANATVGTPNPANTVKGSSHDLSSGAVVGSAQSQICVFCHTPHNANVTTGGPLWSHAVSNQATYTPYSIDPLLSNVANMAGTGPGTISKACLGCHDGSVAVGYIANGAFNTTAANLLAGDPNLAGYAATPKGSSDKTLTPFAVGGKFDITGSEMMTIGAGGNLSTTHPIGVTYPAVSGTTFKVAPTVGARLYGGQVECASCHEPHNQGAAEARYFLRSTNDGSALCLQCHNK